jgi:hypothetical protein
VPKGYWKSQQNVEEYFSTLASNLRITDYQEFNDISYKSFVNMKGFPLVINIVNVPLGAVLLKNYGGLSQMLAKHFPEHAAESYRRNPSKSQLMLLRSLEGLFPNVQILTGYRNPELGPKFYLGIYIPQHKLAFR